MRPSDGFLRNLHDSLPPSTQEHLQSAIDAIVGARERGGRVVVVTGSGPNIHEGVTTQIAELIRHGRGRWRNHKLGRRRARNGGNARPREADPHAEPGHAARFRRRCCRAAESSRSPSLRPSSAWTWRWNSPEDWDDVRSLLGVARQRGDQSGGQHGVADGPAHGAAGAGIRDARQPVRRDVRTVRGLRRRPHDDDRGRRAAQDVPVLVSIPQLVGGGAVGHRHRRFRFRSPGDPRADCRHAGQRRRHHRIGHRALAGDSRRPVRNLHGPWHLGGMGSV